MPHSQGAINGKDPTRFQVRSKTGVNYEDVFRNWLSFATVGVANGRLLN